MRLFRFSFNALASIVAVLCAARAFGALYFDFPKASGLAAIVFAVAVLVAVVLVRGKLLKLAVIFGAFAVVASQDPNNDPRRFAAERLTDSGDDRRIFNLHIFSAI
jgi:hypothetical protein